MKRRLVFSVIAGIDLLAGAHFWLLHAVYGPSLRDIT
jgi:hypothetical protein